MLHRIARFVAPLAALAAPLSADVLRVPEDYASLVDAVAASSSGDEIEVGPGEYLAPMLLVDLPMDLTFRGAGPELTRWIADDWGLWLGGPGAHYEIHGVRIVGGEGVGLDLGLSVLNLLGGRLRLEDVVFEGLLQPALWATGAHLELERVRVLDCDANGPEPDQEEVRSEGIVFAEGCTVLMQDCEFARNRCETGELGSRLPGTVALWDCVSQLYDSEWRDNQATSGGGLQVREGSLIAIGCEFRDNRVLPLQNEIVGIASGGGLALQLCEARIDDCEIVGNRAEGDIAQGGGVWISGGEGEWTNTLVQLNFAQGALRAHGGGADLNGGAQHWFERCAFRMNLAQGEQLARGGGLEAYADDLRFMDCNIEDNLARSVAQTGNWIGASGGGLHSNAERLSFSRSRILRNAIEAPVLNGAAGLHVGRLGGLSSGLSRCLVAGNEARALGAPSLSTGVARAIGGVSVQHGSGWFRITDSTLAGNAAWVNGPGRATGGVEVVAGASLSVTSSILSENCGPSLYVSPSSVAEFRRSLFDGPGPQVDPGPGASPQLEFLDVDPRFCLPDPCQPGEQFFLGSSGPRRVDESDFDLVANSYALPANNPWGERIGYSQIVCQDVGVLEFVLSPEGDELRLWVPFAGAWEIWLYDEARSSLRLLREGWFEERELRLPWRGGPRAGQHLLVLGEGVAELLPLARARD